MKGALLRTGFPVAAVFLLFKRDKTCMLIFLHIAVFFTLNKGGNLKTKQKPQNNPKKFQPQNTHRKPKQQVEPYLSLKK